MKILGIETSCDETGAAIIEANPGDKTVKILSNVVTSSLNLHSKTGGIIPEVAAREQVKFIIPVVKQALKEANIRHSGERSDSRISNHSERFWTSQNDNSDIDVIAVTYGPGLIGSLLVGVETARTLSYVWQKPIIPVNHLIGHIYANWLKQGKVSKEKNVSKVSNGAPFDTSDTSQPFDTPKFPCIALIVSGGHTDLVLMKKHGDFQLIGGTRDDAAGECFDKCARLLGYDYPGGPKISFLAEKGNPKAFHLPRPMIGTNDLDFSFSGLKTAFMRLAKEKFLITNKPVYNAAFQWNHIVLENTLSESDKQVLRDLCASLEQSIIDVLVSKTLKAAQKYKVKSILLGGGVAANQKLCDQFALEIRNLKLEIALSVPSKNLCTDNAAMIATAAFFNYKEVPWQEVKADPELYFN